MGDILPLVSLMKEIDFVLYLQGNTTKVLCRLFENPVTVHKENQGEIALLVAPQIRHHTKDIAIKYHHFWIFVTHGDVDIKHIDIKEHIADNFIKPLDYGLFGYLVYNFNSW